jgi:hypothetical protein
VVHNFKREADKKEGGMAGGISQNFMERIGSRRLRMGRDGRCKAWRAKQPRCC